MGGKTGTTKSSVSIPPEVLARYNAVNAYAGDIAKTPFQGYQGQFVAGLTPTQQAGIQATSQYSQAAQPYYGAATQQLMQAQQSAMPGISAAYQNVGGAQDVGQQYAQAATSGIGAALDYSQPYLGGATQAAMMGAQGIQPGQLQTAQFMNPYTQAVAQTTQQALMQQQQEQMAGQLGNAIRSGAFGGDRAALAASNLARQQQLGMAQAMAPIYQQGYAQALQTAQQQQGVQLSAEQANRAALQNLSQQLQGIGQAGYGQQMGAAQQLAGLGQQQYGQGMGAAQQLAGLAQQGYGMGAATSQALAGLGTGAQQAALQGAQAQLGAGTLEQQTQQADLTAQYQQFLQERGYPFQVAQFLANIAMGTGALSGSSTTTTQPMPFFSDRRVKDDVKEIGKTHDGMPIYSFKYKGDDRTQVGLMAQDVEKKHPEAVGEYGGIKTVDYKRATEDAERSERYSGGIVPASMGGSVTEPGAYGRGGYADGGFLTDPNDIQALLAQQQSAFGPFGESGIYQGSQHQSPYASAKGIVPQAKLHTPRLLQAGPAPRLPDSTAEQALKAMDSVSDIRSRYQKMRDMLSSEETPQTEMDRTREGQSGTSRANLAGPDIMPDKTAEDPSWWEKTGKYLGFMADGGVVPRYAYAAGGMSKDPSLPYEEDDKSPYKYFPTEILETEKPELAKPNTPPPQSGSGLGTALSLAKFALGFFNEGGAVPRSGYQEGGTPDIDRYIDAIAQIESGRNPRAIGPETKKGDRAYGMYQVMGSNIPSWSEEALGRRLTPQEFLADEDAQRDVARYHFGKSYKQYGTPEDAASVWFSGRPIAKAGNASDILGTSVPEYINRFRSALGEENLPARDAKTAQGVVPGVGERKSEGIMPGIQNYLAENQGWLAPTGAFLKGMFQSKSPYLGAAIGEGIGAGLEAIGPAQRQIAETGLTRATTGLTEMQALRQGFIQTPMGNFVYARNKQTGDVELLTANDYRNKKNIYESVVGVNKQPTQGEQLDALSKEKGGFPVPGAPTTVAPTPGAPAPGAPTTTPPTEPGAPPKQESYLTIAPAGTRYDATSRERALQAQEQFNKAQYQGPQQIESLRKQSDDYILPVAKSGEAAKGNQSNIAELTVNLARASKLTGPAAPGTLWDYRANLLKTADTAFRMLDVGGITGDSEAAIVADIDQKMKTLFATARTSEAGQESYAALQQLRDAIASPNMSPQAYAELAATLMAQDRRLIDRQNHAMQWGDDSNQNYVGASADFNDKYKPSEYKAEIKYLASMMLDSPDTYMALMSSNLTNEQKNQIINSQFPNARNMARYFGGQ